MGNTPKERFLGMLGLCVRARRAQCGTQNVCDTLKVGRARIVVMASDNSPATEKRLRDRTAFYRIELIETALGASELGAALGKSGPVAAVAITDDSMAGAVKTAAERYSEQED